jgi:hypothetical protein
MYLPGDDSSRINSDLPARVRPGQENFNKVSESQEFSFGDLLDTLNPLQHIPVVSTIYRELTGDQIAAAPQAMGGMLYGGPAAAVGVLANALTRAESGKDIGELAMAAVTGGDAAAGQASADRQLAAADAEAGAAAPHTPTPGDRPAGAPAADGQAAAADAAAAAQTPTAGAAPARQDAAGSGDPGAEALTGLAALQAFARDVGAAKGAAAADAARPASTSAPAPAERAGQTAAAAEESPADDARSLRRRQTAGVPSEFMPLTDRPVITGTRARTSWAALAAQSDPLGSRRLQGDPSGAPAGPATGAPTPRDTASDRPAERTAGAAPAAEAGTVQPAPMDDPAGQATEAGPAAAPQAGTQGDLAERMMRALDKYEAMHRRRQQ